ncbi:hypothetical protein N7493_000322 [Penicillium malachiteum]|uniref:tRNA-splicing endonuclease subunit Sen15 domain-containing protein n=1 Tax=Penicillium malachiteum TaxID=1324776 RepID=A0AAD6HW95_9EURO|nr:hypothetical protein N7493_000322 [Penicillium malachiteum]
MSLKQEQLPDLELSALTKLIDSASASGNPVDATTIQVLHNLQHQHLWTNLQIHNLAAPDTSNDFPPVRKLLSGIPPNRVYTHPDEQLYMLQKGIREDELRPERLFVIPTAQGQPWSLRRMAFAFDALNDVEVTDDVNELKGPEVDAEKSKVLDEYYEKRTEAIATQEWGSKRMLLAMVDKGMGGDGTVVYYVVQEGEVKPRQN